MKLILMIVLAIALASCDSPIENKVKNPTKKNNGQMQLQQYGIKVSFMWLKGPYGKMTESNQLLVTLQDENGHFVSLPRGQSLNFYSTMPSMGHAMDDAGFFEALGEGVFVNSNIRFNMAGEWLHELRLMDGHYNILESLQWLELL